MKYNGVIQRKLALLDDQVQKLRRHTQNLSFAGAGEAIDKLQILGVISSAEPYRSIVRLRNLIVHEYEQIDPEMLYSIITTRLDDFLKFRDEIDRAV
jgi:uncharacterized protein with HEPN domain